tara:strand:- start:1453 stop:1794 length:342 start_codon:yes stop_codon:yes gene_type:complete
MPTYDYRCEACDHEFELFQQMSAPVETVCPKCGLESLRRLVGTGGGILFKGSGFYETDYRSASYKKAADSDRKSNDSAAKPTETGGTKKSSDSSGGSGSSRGSSGSSSGSGAD